MRYRSKVRPFEWLAIANYGYLALACWLPPLPARRRAGVIAAASAAAVAVWVIGHDAPPFVREWAPLAYILAGYFLSGHLFATPSRAIESWLIGCDRRPL